MITVIVGMTVDKKEFGLWPPIYNLDLKQVGSIINF
jgi:hypothetical protein